MGSAPAAFWDGEAIIGRYGVCSISKLCAAPSLPRGKHA
ncbi:hypothetical protein APY04_3081 [Hyphomicrobium sulfonivorans]|uniref:Uncharacterized protein n=1 Tax=Hyphomicrobium sulfonivorans TaxID=121290 RepID=A0A125NU00_HYPSL|nr:hypothetical protein APY04_3081 [Hyphomicrobium sulfonivorans]